MPEDNTINIGGNIRRFRHQRGLSLSELSRQSEISRGHLHSVESGDSELTQDKLVRLAHVLGVLVSELTGEIEIPPFDVPESLRLFAEKANLSPDDIVMLSRINYRGKRPDTEHEWKMLYTVIKGTLEDKD